MSSISFFLFQISHFSGADLCESVHPSREFPSIQRGRRWSAWSWRSYQTATTTTMLLLPLWRRGSFLHLFFYVDAKQLDWMKPIRAWWPPGQRLISCKGRSLSELLDFFGHSLASHWVWMLLALTEGNPLFPSSSLSSKLYFASWTFILYFWAPTGSEPAWYKYTSFCRHCKWWWIRFQQTARIAWD